MDLFGFVKDIGRRVFNKDEEAAENIKEMIEKNNPGVKDLEVFYDTGGIVTLCGECDSVEAREKAVLMVGNVAGVSDIHAAKLKVKPTTVAAAGNAAPKAAAGAANAPKAEPKVEFYVIQSGDTLGKLAKKYYGDAKKYPRIFEANRGVIEDADKIFVGQKIRIPLD